MQICYNYKAMELYDQIRKVSFVFFFILGLAHFLAGLLFVNSYALPASGILNRVLFIPFVLSTLTFALSNFRYYLASFGKTSKKWDWSFIAIGIIVFLSLLAVELFITDLPSPLIPPRGQ